MMNKKLYETIKSTYPHVDIVMASKYLETLDDFMPFIEANFLTFGENRDDSLLKKQAMLKAYPIEWHFIGTLQTKKVKKVISAIDVLHSLDRLKLAEEIEKRRETVLPCFLQVNISHEDNKHGFLESELDEVLKTLNGFKKIQLIGFMGMALETSDEALIKAQFRTLKNLLLKYQTIYPSLKKLSMGMSQDYHIALKEGATTLRLGRILLDGGLHGT